MAHLTYRCNYDQQMMCWQANRYHGSRWNHVMEKYQCLAVFELLFQLFTFNIYLFCSLSPTISPCPPTQMGILYCPLSMVGSNMQIRLFMCAARPLYCELTGLVIFSLFNTSQANEGAMCPGAPVSVCVCVCEEPCPWRGRGQLHGDGGRC